MYQDKLAFALKVNGRVLREIDETVFLPFGSEYSLLIKNMNNRRACVRITIDGADIVPGGLVVGKNSTVDLERFVGTKFDGQRFKFIERTEKIEQHRGVGMEDGLIRVEFEYEKDYYSNYYTPPNTYERLGGYSGGLYGVSGSNDDSVYYKSARRSRGVADSGLLGSVTASSSYSGGGAAAATASGDNMINFASNASVNDTGITVGGSISDQKFTTTTFYGDGKTSVMIMKLRGDVGQKAVVAPVTVKTKTECPSCGHLNKAGVKFCPECGTGLEIA